MEDTRHPENKKNFMGPDHRPTANKSLLMIARTINARSQSSARRLSRSKIVRACVSGDAQLLGLFSSTLDIRRAGSHLSSA
jgi:hypothetical protein